MTKKFRSKISAAVHESMSDLRKSGLIDDAKMREFDQSCLKPDKEAGGGPRAMPAPRRATAGLQFRVFKDTLGEWRWQLLAANGMPVASSGEGYKSKQDCVSAIDLVKSAANAEIVSAA